MTTPKTAPRLHGPLGTALVIIPTYNEAENISWITARRSWPRTS